MPNTEKEPMEKIKQCSTCKYWKKVYEADETSYGICNAPVPIATVNLLKEVEIPNNVLDICSMECTDGSDCNAYAGLEEVDTLERVKGILQTIKSDSQKVAEEISDQANTPSEFLPPDSYEPYDEGYNDAKRDFSDKLLSIINGETK